MRVAVTGGSGVVGTAVTSHLVGSGHEVRALAHSTGSGAKLGSLGATPVPGDVLDYDGVRSLVDGCEWVFHIAGVNQICARDSNHMWRVNVEGTRIVMDACRDARVSRMIHTSSVVTLGERKGEVATESVSHRGFYLSEYERAKTEAERLLFREAGSLDVVAVNPSSVQGPGRATGTGRIFLNAARGRLPFLIDTTISLVDIDDCARGHVLAAERGAAGERYLLSGATLTMREAVDLLSAVTGRDVPPRFLPPGVFYAISVVVETVFRVIRRQPPICREAVRVIGHGHHYDGSRAARELGLHYTPVEDTIRRTVEWFADEGLLHPDD
ncbi:MAG: NAD-dependent epimerase/dehydratase family protein [Actinobacteria bacterium]|nr:NAD-dependent epimerase/dehydratase family protein [Actinomycetota bacterium]